MKLTKLRQLIKESYQKDDCGCENCGCGKAPLLTESKVKHLLSEGLQYHIDKQIPLHETIYRYGSEKHLMLIKEARRMYSRGVIDLSEADKQLVETHLGEFALYEGVEVPLDLPMVNEDKEYSTLDLHNIARRLKNQGFVTRIKPARFDKGIYDVTYFSGDIDDLQLALNDIFGRDNYRISFDEAKNWKQVGDTVYVKNVFGDEPKEKPKYDPKKGLTDLQKFVFKYELDISDENSAKKHLGDIQQLISPDDVYDYYAYDRGWEGSMDDDLENIYKQVKKKFSKFNENLNEDKADATRWFSNLKYFYQKAFRELKGEDRETYKQLVKDFFSKLEIDDKIRPVGLNEKKKPKKKKKDPPIGKPKRGGSKAYYVYVKDKGKIKKVSFGSGGLRAKIKDSKARAAFAKRHRCSEKNDRTKPSYWSCRLPRYAQALGLGSNSNTFW